MINIINDLFQEAGFNKLQSNSFSLFRYNDKTSFWLVVEADTLELLTQQDELFEAAKKIVDNDSKFDKNSSLLLIYKIPDDTEIKKFKKQIIEIEEDPYQFKKHVLIYSESQKELLKEKLVERSFDDLLLDQKNFNEYKEKFNESNWQTLLYRITQKLPFIKINTVQEKEISSLPETISSKVNQKQLNDINKVMEENFFSRSIDDIKGMNSNDVFKLLLNNDASQDETND
ncbi:ABC-three component system middle component 1 [Flammeovirga aprica]|uniref:Uncharacterized protein n=1 Tax=Flammeovirga aprica JL-4 TaxID=694437 RepID=A0A7X9NZ36_9BACT|nr:ABC-three component system middle component 1 [Flammeovirga aprica]NME66581.1 hypothetical protein [Flammeovirga aprica JL-4]